jgi:tRNA nucleotidyltransferase/poly(A) polymerase
MQKLTIHNDMTSILELMGCNFTNFVNYKEGKDTAAIEPHVIKADPPMKIPAGLKRLAEAFKKAKEVSIGKEIDTKAGGEKDVTLKAKRLFIVGGAVRDHMLNHTPKNFDLATDAHPEEVTKILQAAKPSIQIVKQDPKKGCTTVKVDGESYEIQTLKKKSDNKEEGDVFTAEPGEDSQSRDYTVNALYYDICANQIIDHVGGLRHLQDGTVKAIGGADKLKADGMTKFKGMRLLNTMPNGKFDDETKAAMDKHSGDDEDLNPEKVREEFLRGLEHAHSDVKKYIQSYAQQGLLAKVFPKLQISKDVPDSISKSRPLVLAFLLKDNKPSKLVPALKALKYSDREIKDAVYLINLLWFAPDFVYEFKKELLNTSLTRRQILDWAKLVKLDKGMIEKLVDYQLRINGDNVPKSPGEDATASREKIKKMEADEFKKTLSEK